MAPFKYEPLTEDVVTIRLLSIQHHSSESCITCTLTEASLEDVQGQYIALSHVWGNDLRTARISLNGQPFYTTPQTWQFLCLAKERNVVDPLWIDAICIDQSKSKEKSQQIPLMGKIYSGAKSLLSWLWSPFDKGSIDNPVFAKHHQALAAISNAPIPGLFADLQSTDVRQALLRLIFHNYWSRIWIVQEIRLSQTREFWWEGQVMSSRRLEVIAEALLKQIPGSKLGSSALNTMAWDFLCAAGESNPDHDRPTLFDHVSIGKTSDLLTLNDNVQTTDIVASIVQYGRFRCSLRADHVLGLLGLVVHGESFVVDQSMTETDLLAQIYAFNHVEVAFQDFRKMANVLSSPGYSDDCAMFQRVICSWAQELAVVLDALETRNPSLTQRINQLRSPTSQSARQSSGNTFQRLSAHRRSASWLFNGKRTARSTSNEDSGLLKVVEQLVADQSQNPVLKSPLIGMYYWICPKKSKRGQQIWRITKIMKVSSTASVCKSHSLAVRISHINTETKSNACPPLSLQTSMLALVSASMTVPSATWKDSQDLRTPRIVVTWNLLDLFKVFELSKDSNVVWKDSHCWTFPDVR